MSEVILNCKGLACPAPVLKTKEAIERKQPEKITVIVDNPAARENVKRILEKSGYICEINELENEFTVSGILKGEGIEQESCPVCLSDASQTKRFLVLIGTNKLGSGSDELSEKLMINFISTLKEMLPNLWRIVFLNSGVFLTTQDSKVISTLKELEERGVSILVCGTCLNFYGIMDQKEIGETTNMLDIVTSMEIADKVISIT